MKNMLSARKLPMFEMSHKTGHGKSGTVHGGTVMGISFNFLTMEIGLYTLSNAHLCKRSHKI